MDELVLVRWRDAYFDFDQDGIPGDYLVSTMGFVVGSGPLYLSIAAEKLPEGYRAITHIPRVLVTEMVELAEFDRKES